jgi:hypothetical protein
MEEGSTLLNVLHICDEDSGCCSDEHFRDKVRSVEPMTVLPARLYTLVWKRGKRTALNVRWVSNYFKVVFYASLTVRLSIT